MAEITKVTTPLIPKENLGNRNKPVSDQAFDLTDPSKIHKPTGDEGKILDHQRDGQAAMRESISREMFAPVLKNVNDLMHVLQKVAVMVQMGISTSDIVNSAEVRALLNSLYLTPGQLTQALKEQDGAAVMFKGAVFDLLRDINGKFSDNPRVQQAMTHLLKVFEYHVNTENSTKTILTTCQNLLDYMFSGDRAQFSQYLEGLADLLLPKPQPEAAQQNAMPQNATAQNAAGSEAAANTANPANPASPSNPTGTTNPAEANLQASAAKTLGVEPKEAAQILKNNLLPLLGEIVVKYNQHERIRDMVMVVVHNIVRVDQGTPESLQEAIAKLVAELKQVANLSDDFQQQLTQAMFSASDKVKEANNSVLEKLSAILSETLSSQSTNPATLRQAENLLFSLLQNQSAVMNVLHFMLPMETAQGKLFAEMYVDPDSDEKVGRSQERSRKLFLAFDSESLGAFELCFLETAERVDFSMWCPERFVKSLSGLKRQISDIMQAHGYTMSGYQVSELVTPKSIVQVFPKLMERKMSVDVRI